MPKTKKIIRGAVLMTIGQVLMYGLSFIRNLVLARMLAKADFALASVFSMAMTLLEVSGRMSFGMQVIQSKFGDTPLFQATAHSMQFIGGLCSALLIVGLSVPMARMFGTPDIWWAFALLSLMPLLQGLTHMDICRRQRELDYRPQVIIDITTQSLMTIAVWPLGHWLGDYRVILFLLVGKSTIAIAMTYAFARRPYRWAWHRDYVWDMLKFGWPLLLTGLLIFGSQEANQMIIGAVFSLPVLANYALAFSLVSIPWSIFGQVMSSIMLPLMAQAQSEPERFRRQYRFCAQFAAISGVVLLMPLIVSGEQIVRLLYGSKYSDTGAFMAILGATASLRFMRYPPAVAAMARGDTLNQLYSNLARITSLPLALGVWHFGGSAVLVAVCAMAGEIMAIVSSIVRLWKQQQVPPSECYGASIYMSIMLSLGVMVALIGGPNFSIWTAALVAVIAVAVAIGTAWVMFPEITQYIITITRRHKFNSALAVPL